MESAPMYFIKKCLDVLQNGNNESSVRVRIRWKGYPPQEDLYRPLSDFDENGRIFAENLIEEYKEVKEEALKEYRKKFGRPYKSKEPIKTNFLAPHIKKIHCRCHAKGSDGYIVEWVDEELYSFEPMKSLYNARDLIKEFEDKRSEKDRRLVVDKKGVWEKVINTDEAKERESLLKNLKPYNKEEAHEEFLKMIAHKENDLDEFSILTAILTYIPSVIYGGVHAENMPAELDYDKLFHGSIRNDHIEAAMLLSTLNVDIDSFDDATGRTAMTAAAEKNDVLLATHLLTLQADLEKADRNEKTPVQVACAANSYEFLVFYVENKKETTHEEN